MCGLAGWNVSEKFASTHLTPEVTEALCRVGFAKNLHRGQDAAGWMSYNPLADNELTFWKDKGSALDTILHKDSSVPFPPAFSQAVSLHTRAKTTFTADDNDNNHPVVDEYVCVTHNGNVRNHQVLRSRWQLHGITPNVDSWVIAAGLRKLWNDPRKYAEPGQKDKLKDLIEDFDGAIVFAAMWNHHQPFTLLVAGAERDLWVGRYKTSIFYASEPEALVKMIELLPDKEKFKIGSLKENQFALLLNGRVVMSDKIEDSWVNYSTNQFTKKEVELIRYADDLPYFLEDNSTRYHWTDVRTEFGAPLSIYDVDDDDPGIQHFDAYKTQDMIRLLPTAWPPGFMEADNISVWTKPGTDMKHVDSLWFLQFGDIEIVTSGIGSIKDLYNWGNTPLEERGSQFRWIETSVLKEGKDTEPPEKRLSLTVEVSYDWPAAIKLLEVRNEERLARIAELQKKAAEEEARKLSLKSQLGGRHKEKKPMQGQVISDEDIEFRQLFNIVGKKKIEVEVINDVPWAKINGNRLYYSANRFWFAYTANKYCIKHAGFIATHDFPDLCDVAIETALRTFAYVQNLDDVYFIFGQDAIRYVEDDKSKCNGKHVWDSNIWRVFKNANWRMPYGESCDNCEAKRYWDYSQTEEPFLTLYERGV